MTIYHLLFWSITLISASCAILTIETDLGVEVANILKISREKWTALPEDCLLKVNFGIFVKCNVFTCLLGGVP